MGNSSEPLLKYTSEFDVGEMELFREWLSIAMQRTATVHHPSSFNCQLWAVIEWGVLNGQKVLSYWGKLNVIQMWLREVFLNSFITNMCMIFALIAASHLDVASIQKTATDGNIWGDFFYDL